MSDHHRAHRRPTAFMKRWFGAAAVISVIVITLGSCGSDETAEPRPDDGSAEVTAAPSTTEDGGPPYEVVFDLISHETTKEISVWSPAEDGEWPVVFALHGTGGNRSDMAETATALASQGVVVFAPTYRTDMSSSAAALEAVQDAECGYRYARSVAADYGGDLGKPMTMIGYSLGATFVLTGGLTEDTSVFGPANDCFEEVPRADVIVAISGCHYEFEGQRFDLDMSNWANLDADVTLLAGGEDEVCALWQSQAAAEAMRSAGYGVDLIVLEGANHYAPIFHDLVDGEWVVVPDDPNGEQAVEVILDAIAAHPKSE